MKSNGASTSTSENSVGFESCFLTLTQNLTTFTQNMTNIYYGIHAKRNARTVEVTKPNAANPPVYKMSFLKICFWNANGLNQHKSEITYLLISETQFNK